MEKEQNLKALQEHLGFNDQEMAEFTASPANQKILATGPKLAGKTMELEVIKSHGCLAGHKAGDKIHLDGSGAILAHKGPSKICPYAISGASPAVFAAVEMLMSGMDPNKMHFRRAHCLDVGLACGGWGEVVMELSVRDREGQNA